MNVSKQRVKLVVLAIGRKLVSSWAWTLIYRLRRTPTRPRRRGGQLERATGGVLSSLGSGLAGRGGGFCGGLHLGRSRRTD